MGTKVTDLLLNHTWSGVVIFCIVFSSTDVQMNQKGPREEIYQKKRLRNEQDKDALRFRDCQTSVGAKISDVKQAKVRCHKWKKPREKIESQLTWEKSQMSQIRMAADTIKSKVRVRTLPIEEL